MLTINQIEMIYEIIAHTAANDRPTIAERSCGSVCISCTWDSHLERLVALVGTLVAESTRAERTKKAFGDSPSFSSFSTSVSYSVSFNVDLIFHLLSLLSLEISL
ncbi:hypothetical protein F0562_027772 [Nyssa sinensis]|uniref:Uncharacterized protein n=1 Tax=Nyssa sinensis TaxID=561372 RepID=A0A5J5B6G9_9ASTE|nr:hypothetical protein F0562_027772 [Nyssa sinensis]